MPESRPSQNANISRDAAFFLKTRQMYYCLLLCGSLTLSDEGTCGSPVRDHETLDLINSAVYLFE